MKKGKYLITGCAGFIGSNLVKKIHKKYDLILIDLWWKEDEVTQQIQDDIKSNYNSHLETNGKILIPLIEKEL